MSLILQMELFVFTVCLRYFFA